MESIRRHALLTAHPEIQTKSQSDKFTSKRRHRVQSMKQPMLISEHSSYWSCVNLSILALPYVSYRFSERGPRYGRSTHLKHTLYPVQQLANQPVLWNVTKRGDLL